MLGGQGPVAVDRWGWQVRHGQFGATLMALGDPLGSLGTQPEWWSLPTTLGRGPDSQTQCVSDNLVSVADVGRQSLRTGMETAWPQGQGQCCGHHKGLLVSWLGSKVKEGP